MLIIWSAVYQKDKSMGHIKVISKKQDINEALIECLQQICLHFDIEMPMWHTKHTKELASFRKATFKKDDFIDKFKFDRLTIEIMEK